MSFLSDRTDLNEMKKSYLGGIVGGIIGGWILLTIMGSYVMPIVANVDFLVMLGDAMKVDTTISFVFHLMTSLFYGLLFVFLLGKQEGGNNKVLGYGVVYGLILVIPLLMVMALLGTDVIALMGDIPLVMMIMVNHIAFGLGVGAGVYYVTK